MIRLKAIIAIFMVAVVSAEAQVELRGTNIVGTASTNISGSTSYAYQYTNSADLVIVDSTITGATALNVDTNKFDGYKVYGDPGFGTGVKFEVYATNSTFVGGSGGKVKVDDQSEGINASGASGMVLGGTSLSLTDGQILGGNGGEVTISNATLSIDANGGSALQLLRTSTIAFYGTSSATGGVGGIVKANTAAVVSASGGAGVDVRGATSTIDQGTFVGGKGGTVTANAASDADGGSGLHLYSSTATQRYNVTVNGGTFVGGEAGLVNGNTASKGASIKINGAGTLNLHGGTFDGGFLVSGNGAVTNNILNTVVFGSGFTNSFDLRQTGGVVAFSGWNDNTFTNVVVTAGKMDFNESRYNLASSFTLDSTNAVVGFNGGLEVAENGILSLGKGSVLVDNGLGVSKGKVDLGEGKLEVGDGLTINDGGVVLVKKGTLKINEGFTINKGGQIELGVQTLNAGNVQINEGASVVVVYTNGTSGSSVGKVVSSGDLTIENKVNWTIAAGNNIVTNGAFEIASAGVDGDLHFSLDKSYLALTGKSKDDAGWLGGLDVFAVGNSVQAKFTRAEIDDALGIISSDASPFDRAVINLSAFATNGSAAYNAVGSASPTKKAAQDMLKNGFTRTSESANTIMGMQTMIADQVRLRSRTMLNHDEVGYSSSPVGAMGWDSIRNFSDNMEDRFGYGNVRDFMHSMVPYVEVDPGMKQDWQVWGRGFGTLASQDDVDGFSGYDATIGGGMFGIDRRINNMLMGVGAGFTHSIVDGNAGNDLTAEGADVLAYISAHDESAFISMSASYGFNAVETDFETYGYEGDYDAHTLGLYLDAGYSFKLTDSLVFSPEASLLNTMYMREGYTRSSSLGMPSLDYDDYDQWSHVGQIGGTITSLHKIEFVDLEMAFRPEIRAFYQHEFNAEMDDETYTMEGSATGETLHAALLMREEDLVKVGAGVRFAKWGEEDSTEFGLGVDAMFGDNYDAYMLSGKILQRF